MKIFDTHIHFPAGFFSGGGLDTNTCYRSLNALAERCSKLNIERACLIGGPGILNDWVRKALDKFPDFFVGLAYFDLDAEKPESVSRYREQGFKGLKFILPRMPYDDPSYYGVYAQAEAEGMVSLFHTGIIGGPYDFLQLSGQPDERIIEKCKKSEQAMKTYRSSSLFMQPLTLDTISMQYPELKIIGAHLGYGHYDTACAVARWRRNVWFDISGGEVVRRHILEGLYIKKEISVGKLTFGSDSSLEDMEREVRGWLAAFENIGLSNEEAEAILYNNAAYIFK